MKRYFAAASAATKSSQILFPREASFIRVTRVTRVTLAESPLLSFLPSSLELIEKEREERGIVVSEPLQHRVTQRVTRARARVTLPTTRRPPAPAPAPKPPANIPAAERQDEDDRAAFEAQAPRPAFRPLSALIIHQVQTCKHPGPYLPVLSGAIFFKNLPPIWAVRGGFERCPVGLLFQPILARVSSHWRRQKNAGVNVVALG